MKISTVSHQFGKVDGWMPSPTYIQRALENNEIVTLDHQFCPCGCGIKIDLQSILYPALRELLDSYPEAAELGLGVRQDVSFLKGKFAGYLRKKFSLEDLDSGAYSTIEDVLSFGGSCVLELLSLKDDCDQKIDAQKKLHTFLEKKLSFLKKINEDSKKRNFPPLMFGKAHSVYAGGDFIVFDILKCADAEVYLVANHDAIITSDSMINNDCTVSVMTSLGNALNDLFVAGATDEMTIIPIYDGKKESCDQMMKAILSYCEFFQERGVQLNLLDCGPLLAGIQIMGATVIGHTTYEFPKFSGLLPGQEILLTHPLGDASFLNLHRHIHFEEKNHENIDQIRYEILQKQTTPNFLISKIIRKYLPRRGETFDPLKHITFCSDISGPGLFVLEEGAVASHVDIYIEDIQFIDKRSLSFYRKNHTSSVNGPIAIAAAPEILIEIEKDLSELGLREFWRVGRVLQKSKTPKIFVKSELRSEFFSVETNTDFFSFFSNYSYAAFPPA